MKLIRAGIYLGVLAFLLPSPPDERTAASAAVPAVVGAHHASEGDVFTAAVNAVDDFSGFCSRQPGVCDTAHAIYLKVEGKARYGIRLLYEWAQGPEPRSASIEAGLHDPMRTGSVGKAAGPRRKVDGTLTPADLAPAWRAPATRKS